MSWSRVATEGSTNVAMDELGLGDKLAGSSVPAANPCPRVQATKPAAAAAKFTGSANETVLGKPLAVSYLQFHF